MSSWRSYVNHMSQKDLFDFSASLLATIVVGATVIFVIWQIVSRRQKAAKPKIPRRAAANTPPPVGSASTIKPAEKSEQAGLPPVPEGFVRRIPRAAQAALVDRGQRLLSEKNFEPAMVCFLSLLYSTAGGGDGAAKEERLLPTHLTECLRGAAQCFRATGQNELAVKFLQAERRVFEEMVVQAAHPEGTKQGTPTESILGSLLGRGAKGGSLEELPKRCFTLDEVSEACTKLGYHDVALAYRVKSAALKSKITGKPLDPESEEAAQLARAIGEFKSRHPSAADAAESAADAGKSPTEAAKLPEVAGDDQSAEVTAETAPVTD